jgi:hypothetical protein
MPFTKTICEFWIRLISRSFLAKASSSILLPPDTPGFSRGVNVTRLRRRLGSEMMKLYSFLRMRCASTIWWSSLDGKEKERIFSIIRSSKIAIFANLNLAYLARFFFYGNG